MIEVYLASTKDIQLYDVNWKMNKQFYNPPENAKQLARLIILNCPGDTLDFLLRHIVKEIRKTYVLIPPMDIENEIRISLINIANLPEHFIGEWQNEKNK